METYEFEGKTTEEAINNAAREMDVSPEDLDFEIIEPGSAGIFGLVGTRKTRIKVTISKNEDLNEDLNEDTDEYTDSYTDEEMDDDEKPDEPIDLSEGLETARETLEKILSLIPIETTVSAESENGKIHLNIQGDSSGLLIGRKGKTLDALQYIVNKTVNKTLDSKLRVIIDSENYRERRLDSLTQMALKIGDKVSQLKKPFSTNPLNPHDRRIVHLALKDNAKLETRSRGEGIHKRVIVFPRKK